MRNRSYRLIHQVLPDKLRLAFHGLFIVLLLNAIGFSSLPVAAAQATPNAPFSKIADGSRDVALAADDAGRVFLAWLFPQQNRVGITTLVGGQRTENATLQLPVQVSAPTTSGETALAVSNNTLHLIAAGGGSLCYMSRPLSTDDWSNTNCSFLPNTVSGSFSRLQLAAMNNGILAMAWETGQGTIGVALRQSNGEVQLLPDPAADYSQAKHWPRLGVDGSNNLTLVWEQQRENGPGNSYRSEIVGRTWQNNSWSVVASLSGFDSNAGQWSARQPTLAVSADGTLHLAYILFAPFEDYQGPKEAVLYRYGTLNQLQPAEQVAATGVTPVIGVRDNRVELAWSVPIGTIVSNLRVQNYEIEWSRRNNTNSWLTPVNISYSAGDSYFPALALAADGNSLVSWKDATSLYEPGEIFYTNSTSQQNGQNWPTPSQPDTQALQNYVARVDAPVASNQTQRSWLYGPTQWQAATEPYAEAPAATRYAFYYDKARIEISNPNLSSTDPGYFTNGLLVTEMASGRLQLGNNLFVSTEPAPVTVAGDPGNPLAPTYATFRPLVFIPEIGQSDKAPNRTGQTVTECINREGVVSSDCAATNLRVSNAQYISQTGHNIPLPFWDYLNQRGPVLENGQLQPNQTVFEWVRVMGYPITEAYWTRAIVGGQEREVMVQLFQRRVLTYTPANSLGFRVEMGNVGQHYYLWRYRSAPWVS